MRFTLGLALTLLSSPAILLAESVPPSQRTAAAYLLALGRAPAPGELAADRGERDAPIAQQVETLRNMLRTDAAAQRAVAAKAWRDAFGPQRPDAHGLGGPSVSGVTYSELMRRHLEQLAAQPTEYERVIHRAYQMVVRREAYDLELVYWKKYDTLSYALLVGCIEDWARRNQPGLMVTAGTPTVSINSEFLTTARLSPAVAQEAREAVGLVAEEDAASALASGRNLVAPGGAGLVTGGRMVFAAAGR